MQLNHEIHDWGNPYELTKHAISYIADSIISLQYMEEGRNLRRFVRVVKVRGSEHSSDLHPLHITRGGITIGELTAGSQR